jgi:putative MATE family efflux protein
MGFGFIMLAKIGTSVKVSQSAGMNNEERITKFANNGFLLMFLLGGLYTIFGVFGAEYFINWFETGNANIDLYAISYLQIVSSFGLTLFLVNLINGVYDGLGQTYITLIVTSSGLFLNIILDPIFILDEINVFQLFTIQGLSMGVEGAAIATAIGQSVNLLIYLIIFVNRKWRPFDLKLFSQFDLSYIKEIIKVGVFVGVQSMLFTFISMYLAKMVVSFGEKPMAIQRVGSQIESFAWMIASGFQVALASFVGQNFGAQKYDRIKKGYLRSMQILIPYGIIINVLFFVFARQLFSLFFSNPETLDIGTKYLRILSFSQVFMIIELTSAGVFNGLGRTFYPSIVGVIGNLLRIPTAVFLTTGILIGGLSINGFGMDYTGIWIGISGSSIMKGSVLAIWLIYFLKRLGKPGGILFENNV